MRVRVGLYALCVTWSCAVASRVGFPSTYGPWSLRRTRLRTNDFQFSRPLSLANVSTAAFNLSRRSVPECEGYRGLMTPLQSLVLADKVREFTGIPAKAVFFSFAYPFLPPPEKQGKKLKAHDGKSAFCIEGGYMYFDSNLRLLRALAKKRNSKGVFVYGNPQPWRPEWTEQFKKVDRWFPWSKKAGARYMAFVGPREPPLRGKFGAVAFLFHDLDSKDPALLQKDVYFQLLSGDPSLHMRNPESEAIAGVATCLAILASVVAFSGIRMYERGIKNSFNKGIESELKGIELVFTDTTAQRGLSSTKSPSQQAALLQNDPAAERRPIHAEADSASYRW